MSAGMFDINFTFAPEHNLTIDRQERHATVKFEGPLASLLFKGLYARRMSAPEFYPMEQSGPYHGDVRIQSPGEIICEYAHRRTQDGWVEKFASCKLQMKLD
jgi:hypothetical protein